MTFTAITRRGASLSLTITLLVPATAAARQAGPITPDRILAALDVREGATVCEMGAGDGELSLAAATSVGPGGRVYASELGDDRLKGLRAKVGSADSRVTVIAGDPLKTNFPDAACDAIFMRNVYHHFENPTAMNASIAAALKPGGRLAIVDFTPPPGSEATCPADRGKDGMHGVTPATVTRELTEAGFTTAVPAVIVQRAFMVVVSKAQQ
jgi:ubiquinone/menaquinone biosynthesis C-methylase UbiE